MEIGPLQIELCFSSPSVESNVGGRMAATRRAYLCRTITRIVPRELDDDRLRMRYSDETRILTKQI
jgi:hypothetical protein